MANKDTAKQWFETNDFPTEAQFAQVFEWLRWKDEKIAFADLTPELQAQITAIGGRLEFDGNVQSWTFPGHTLIDKVFVKDSVDINFRLGTTVNGIEIFDDVAIELANTQTGLISVAYYCLQPTTIYWSGNNINSKTIFFVK